MVFRKTFVLENFWSESFSKRPSSIESSCFRARVARYACLPRSHYWGGGGGGGGTSSPKLCIEARGKVHFGIVIATVVRNFDLISIQRSSRDMI